ncbi:MAG: GNAT family N-acetyltransferase, partial [Acidilobaceae archaeon]
MISSIIVRQDENLALRLLSEEFSTYHRVFAHAALENSGVGLVAAVNHRIAGSAIGYVAGFEPPKIGVIYYVYVKREHRGRGLGK